MNFKLITTTSNSNKTHDLFCNTNITQQLANVNAVDIWTAHTQHCQHCRYLDSAHAPYSSGEGITLFSPSYKSAN